MGKIKPGLVYIETKSGGYRPFTEFRQIKRGKKKGLVEVLLSARKARRVLVHPSKIRSYPVEFDGGVK